MEKQEALDMLQDKTLDLDILGSIMRQYGGDSDIDAQAAMNISRRVSVDEQSGSCDKRIIALLEQLAFSNDMGARWAVAKSVHTRSALLQKLAEDEVNLVRALVATNPNTPPQCLDAFFTDDKIVKDGLTGNPNTPVGILKQLARDNDKMVRMRTAQNPSLPKDTLKQLAEDENKDVSILANEILGKRD